MKVIGRLLIVTFTILLGYIIIIKINPKVISIMLPKVEKSKLIYHSSSTNVKLIY